MQSCAKAKIIHFKAAFKFSWHAFSGYGVMFTWVCNATRCIYPEAEGGKNNGSYNYNYEI